MRFKMGFLSAVALTAFAGAAVAAPPPPKAAPGLVFEDMNGDGLFEEGVDIAHYKPLAVPPKPGEVRDITILGNGGDLHVRALTLNSGAGMIVIDAVGAGKLVLDRATLKGASADLSAEDGDVLMDRSHARTEYGVALRTPDWGPLKGSVTLRASTLAGSHPSYSGVTIQLSGALLVERSTLIAKYVQVTTYVESPAVQFDRVTTKAGWFDCDGQLEADRSVFAIAEEFINQGPATRDDHPEDFNFSRIDSKLSKCTLNFGNLGGNAFIDCGADEDGSNRGSLTLEQCLLINNAWQNVSVGVFGTLVKDSKTVLRGKISFDVF